jgi:hypothetical protein
MLLKRLSKYNFNQPNPQKKFSELIVLNVVLGCLFEKDKGSLVFAFGCPAVQRLIN